MTDQAVPIPDHEAQLVRARLADLGLTGMVDVHTHFMPRPVMDKVWAYFDQAGPLTGRPCPIAYRLEETERLQLLSDFGVVAFTSLVYPHKPGMATWLNQWAAGFASRTPGCLHTATFYPEADTGSYVAEAIGSGARVFKAHVQVGDYDPNDPLLDQTWGQLQESGTPVLIHSGHGPAPGRFTDPGAWPASCSGSHTWSSSSPTWGCPTTPTSSTSPPATTGSTWTPRWPSPASPTRPTRSRPT
jgi:uncharacterized protein